LKKLLSRGLTAALGSFMLTLGAGTASAQSTTSATATTAVPMVPAVQRTITSTSNMVTNALGTVFGGSTDPRQAELARIAREGRWLASAGWPLYALVDRYSVGLPLDEQGNCLATAVYFEARGESLEGQLAVADVVLNRTASEQYPDTWCDVVKQPWQFSFVRNGQFPQITDAAAWARAQGVARIAMADVMRQLPQDVLWYHADYVSPSWGSRLNYVEKIGVHMFFRA